MVCALCTVGIPFHYAVWHASPLHTTSTLGWYSRTVNGFVLLHRGYPSLRHVYHSSAIKCTVNGVGLSAPWSSVAHYAVCQPIPHHILITLSGHICIASGVALLHPLPRSILVTPLGIYLLGLCLAPLGSFIYCAALIIPLGVYVLSRGLGFLPRGDPSFFFYCAVLIIFKGIPVLPLGLCCLAITRSLYPMTSVTSSYVLFMGMRFLHCGDPQSRHRTTPGTSRANHILWASTYCQWVRVYCTFREVHYDTAAVNSSHHHRILRVFTHVTGFVLSAPWTSLRSLCRIHHPTG